MTDMRAHGVDVLTLGQYLRPTEHHLAVVDYITPQQFDWYRVKGEVRDCAVIGVGCVWWRGGGALCRLPGLEVAGCRLRIGPAGKGCRTRSADASGAACVSRAAGVGVQVRGQWASDPLQLQGWRVLLGEDDSSDKMIRLASVCCLLSGQCRRILFFWDVRVCTQLHVAVLLMVQAYTQSGSECHVRAKMIDFLSNRGQRLLLTAHTDSRSHSAVYSNQDRVLTRTARAAPVFAHGDAGATRRNLRPFG
jgi:hypothetical protein